MKTLRSDELDELVYKAEEIASQLRQNLRDSESGRTQMSKAIEAAVQSRSIPLFINWVRYQTAREKHGEEFWRTPLQGGSLGELVANFATRLQESEPDTERALQKLSLFLGFLRRCLIAIDHLDKIPAQLKRGASQ